MMVYVKNSKYGGGYGDFITPTQASAYYGFQDIGYDTKIVEELKDIPVVRDNIYISGLKETMEWFKQFNINPPLIDYPNELQFFLNRKIIKTTIGELENHIDGGKHFIKPVIEKQFETSIISNYDDLIKFKDMNQSDEIWLSDFKQFVAEYRCYVSDGKLLGVYKYRGYSSIQPAEILINEMIKLYKTSPISYSIDIGVTENYNTSLIEINDGFALSNYGLENYKYALMLLNRFEQLYKEG